MSQNDSTPDRNGGSSSYGGDDVPEYGRRAEGAPSGPSYEPPRYGQGSAGDQYAAPQYGQGQYGQNQYGQGQYGQGQYGQGQYGQGQEGEYGQNAYGQGQQGSYPPQSYGQGQYGQGQQGYPGQYQGQYDMGQYGTGAKPAGTGLGIAALVLGIIALLTSWLFGLGFVPGLVGLILGIVAVRKLGRSPGASKAMPVVGIVLSVLGLLASVFFFVSLASLVGGVFGPCSQYTNDPAAFEQCVNEQMNEQMGVDTLQQ